MSNIYFKIKLSMKKLIITFLLIFQSFSLAQNGSIEKAAQQGHVGAQNNLVLMYHLDFFRDINNFYKVLVERASFRLLNSMRISLSKAISRS